MTTGHGLETHQTRLSDTLPSGALELIAQDDAVIHKAKQACAARDSKSFVFWDGTEERTVTGTVLTVSEGTPFRFSVQPDENGTPRVTEQR